LANPRGEGEQIHCNGANHQGDEVQVNRVVVTRKVLAIEHSLVETEKYPNPFLRILSPKELNRYIQYSIDDQDIDSDSEREKTLATMPVVKREYP
jgi:hypothetical protein